MKKVEEMTIEELWQLFPIILKPHDDRWAVWGRDEIAILRELVREYAVDFHHIGSTAIKGIWAKPIIDILIETSSISNFQFIKSILTEAGYLLMNETEKRICFVKGYTPTGFADKVFHIHIRLSGDKDEIYFRDYLRNNPEIAREYEKLKLSLWKKFEHDRDAYTNAKTDFIRKYTSIAKDLE